MRGLLLAVAVLAATSAPAQAAPTVARSVTLPARQSASPPTYAHNVAQALAARLRIAVDPAPAQATLLDLSELERGLQLLAAGDLDRAAELLDRGLARGAASPHRAGDPRLFVTAHVARASIALARDEPRVAEHLLRRVVEYDPGFSLDDRERSPRVERALLKVRERLGPRPELRIETLGDACAGAGTVTLVARALPDGTTEFRRYDDCRLVSSAVATAHQSADAVAAALAPMQPARTDDAPFYRSTWFWVGTATVAVVGGAAAAFFATRDDPELSIVPHF